jgi:hypothetical protein
MWKGLSALSILKAKEKPEVYVVDLKLWYKSERR